MSDMLQYRYSNCIGNYGQKQKITVTYSTILLCTQRKLYFEWSSRCSSLFHFFFVLGCVIAFQSVHMHSQWGSIQAILIFWVHSVLTPWTQIHIVNEMLCLLAKRQRSWCSPTSLLNNNDDDEQLNKRQFNFSFYFHTCFFSLLPLAWKWYDFWCIKTCVYVRSKKALRPAVHATTTIITITIGND